MQRRILFLADIDSSHTRKWAVSLLERGFAIGIFSIRRSSSDWHTKYPALKVYDAQGFAKEKFSGSSAGKLSYMKLLPAVKQAISEFHPDILHAHYATSYGLLGVRTGFHPFVISVWGSDVFEFPDKSWFHKTLVKRNLSKADRVFSTSEVMKKRVEQLGINDAIVTPFGVDTLLFRKQTVQREFSRETRLIGTIKTLEAHYGIDILIRAFDTARQKSQFPMKLVICGSGTQEKNLRELANSLSSASDIIFKGAIPQEDVPTYLNSFDVFANLSLQESFGVAVVEAMSCGVPCLLSDAPGLKEVSDNGTCAHMVPAGNVAASAEGMLRLLNDKSYAEELTTRATMRVQTHYDWNMNLDDIIKHYDQLMKTV